MATTEIHAITMTPDRALKYIMANKDLPYISDEAINKEVAYQIFEEEGKSFVRYFTLTSYQNCNIRNPYATYKEIQSKWQGVRYKSNRQKFKNGQEPIMWHLHQSFNGMEVSPEVANEIGRRLAEEIFKGFTVTISTHCNTNNIHNHLMISAWNNEGKKWNNCNANYQLIRNVSDRLCKEYGLHVLEATKKVRLIRYKGKDGRLRYYEPTVRKDALIQKRRNGEITNDDIRSYRNTIPYQQGQQKKLDNRIEIKMDIDAILPNCRSYDELLERLRDIGYSIRDKKKNGEWLAHISFRGPLQDKATREDKIGDGIFYLRENLTQYIEAHARTLEKEQPNQNNIPDHRLSEAIPFFSHYEYGNLDLSKMNDDYRKIKDENGTYKIIPRTVTEKKIMKHIRMKDQEIQGLIDTTQLHKLIAEQGKGKHKTQEEKLVAQIQSSFQCLQYVEQHHLFSYEQIIDLYQLDKSKYDAAIENFIKAEKAIGELKKILTIPQKLIALQQKIDSHKNDIAYVLEEYNTDKKTVLQYEEILAKYKINTPQGFQSFEKKVTEWEEKQHINQHYMSQVVTQMAELENCIRTFDRIDTEHGNRNEEAMKAFELIAQNRALKARKINRENNR